MAKETLSAHELNKYTYCPYQWYYEKTYGRTELRRMRKEYLEELGLEDSTTANFVRGEAFQKKVVPPVSPAADSLENPHPCRICADTCLLGDAVCPCLKKSLEIGCLSAYCFC